MTQARFSRGAVRWRLCDRQDCRHIDIVDGLRDRDAAGRWLRRFHSDEIAMVDVRAMLSLHGSPPPSRIPNTEVMDRIAELLTRGLLHVHTERDLPDMVSTFGRLPETIAAFPFSARGANRRAARTSTEDPDTFSADLDSEAQAATLVAAAAEGKPFCPE